MRVFEEASQAASRDRVAVFLRTHLPSRTAGMTDADLHEMIVDGEKQAGYYGIESERGITQFLILRLHVGPHFDEEPEVSHFLSFPGADPERKIQALLDTYAEALGSTKD